MLVKKLNLFLINNSGTKNLYIQLQVLCSNEKKARDHGYTKKKASIITYSKEIDISIADWIYCSIDLGYLVTRKAIQKKALELIQPMKPNLKHQKHDLIVS